MNPAPPSAWVYGRSNVSLLPAAGATCGSNSRPALTRRPSAVPRPHARRRVPMTSNPSPYPVRLDGELDPRLSRWLWLAKWLLVIPHVVVLAFLWIAFMVLWPVALVAILFTGRYPRAIF